MLPPTSPIAYGPTITDLRAVAVWLVVLAQLRLLPLPPTAAGTLSAGCVSNFLHRRNPPVLAQPAAHGTAAAAGATAADRHLLALAGGPAE